MIDFYFYEQKNEKSTSIHAGLKIIKYKNSKKNFKQIIVFG